MSRTVTIGLALAVLGCSGDERSLDRPGQLALTPDGDLLVADFMHHRIARFSADLQFEDAFGERGIGADELWALQGITALPDGGCALVDHELRRIEDPSSDVRRVKIFAPDGNEVRAFEVRRPGDEELGWPAGISAIPEGLVVADFSFPRLLVFTLEGRFVRAIEVRPPAAPLGSTGFVRYAGGLLWVAEYELHRVRALTLDGEERLSLGREGSGAGEVRFPEAVDVAPDGLIAVADVGNHRVVLFHQDGSPAGAITPQPARPGFKVQVVDVRFDRQGRLLVSDSKGDRVLVYRPDGTLLSELQRW